MNEKRKKKRFPDPALGVLMMEEVGGRPVRLGFLTFSCIKMI